jgi:hypothetical protein
MILLLQEAASWLGSDLFCEDLPFLGLVSVPCHKCYQSVLSFLESKMTAEEIHTGKGDGCEMEAGMSEFSPAFS